MVFIQNSSHKGEELNEQMILFYIKLNIRIFFTAGLGFVERFFLKVEYACQYVFWKAFYFQVISFNGFIIILAGNIDTVLRSFYLCLEVAESSRCFKVGISFKRSDQP